MDYIRLFLFNKKLLGFGILLTFFSCFGKTFLISQYVPFLLHDFNLSNTSFTIIYALTTIVSGISIIYVGQLLDHTDLKKFAFMVTLGLIASALLLSISHNVFLLAIALFGMRLSGQGLMNHTSQTALSRFFKRTRGKAVSISVLGHSLGEAILPLSTILLITEYGWRLTLIVSAVFLFVTVTPMIFAFLRKIPKAKEKFAEKKKKEKHAIKENWSVKKVLRDNQFYLLAPNIFIFPFITTAIMFYMIPIADFKGWSTSWISYCFIGYAISNLCSSFISGQLIDRFKAVNLIQFQGVPLIIGFTLILIFNKPWVALPFLMLAGISNGTILCMEAALITEIFGLKNLATVKSVFSTISIIASALGPLFFGLMLDQGYSFTIILLICLIVVSLITINNMRGYTPKHEEIKSVWAIPKVIINRSSDK